MEIALLSWVSCFSMPTYKINQLLKFKPFIRRSNLFEDLPYIVDCRTISLLFLVAKQTGFSVEFLSN